MDSKKIGDYISTLRRKRNLTQKDLADQLGVTDKAVSKWERGAGYPDISLLKPLAEILGTSVNELLEGEALNDKSGVPESNIENALEYADKLLTVKENKIGKIINNLLAVSMLIAICTCVIVNIAVNHRLSWSILVIDGCVMGCLLLLPPLHMKKRGLIYSLGLLTVFIIPFLAVIEYMTSGSIKTSGWLWRIGVPVSITWLVIIWFLLFLYTKFRINLWYFIGIILLLGVPGHIITNYVVDVFTGFSAAEPSRSITAVTTIVSLLALSGICFIIGFNKRKAYKEIN
jgi:transcriptional regulator with XRE-family HTH domain